jgi:intein/homing endonuclease
MDLPQKGEVLTLCGWKPYINPRITQKNARLVEVRFVSGNMVKCTPDHLFLTESGWKSAKDLMPYSKIPSALIQLPSISTVDSIDCGLMKSISQKQEKNYIEKFGNLLLEKFQRIVTSTIEMVIQKITCWKIWNALTQVNICPSVGILDPKQDLQTEQEIWLKNGIDQLKEEFGIKDMQKNQKDGLNGKENLETVYNVSRNSIVLSGETDISRNSAIPIVKPLIIESVKNLSVTEDVWCLTVPDVGHFSLENGAIVHNCDAFRYLAMARQIYGKGGNALTSESIKDMRQKYLGY